MTNSAPPGTATHQLLVRLGALTAHRCDLEALAMRSGLAEMGVARRELWAAPEAVQRAEAEAQARVTAAVASMQAAASMRARR